MIPVTGGLGSIGSHTAREVVPVSVEVEVAVPA
jgi:UDP-glucose 4-epimerase